MMTLLAPVVMLLTLTGIFSFDGVPRIAPGYRSIRSGKPVGPFPPT
ncbi:hypothetical protein [Brevibacillus massiliensis]|nr:hypothetical protein [Brevibacillus massiliensis]